MRMFPDLKDFFQMSLVMFLFIWFLFIHLFKLFEVNIFFIKKQYIVWTWRKWIFKISRLCRAFRFRSCWCNSSNERKKKVNIDKKGRKITTFFLKQQQKRYKELFFVVDTCQGATLPALISANDVIHVSSSKKGESSYGVWIFYYYFPINHFKTKYK